MDDEDETPSRPPAPSGDDYVPPQITRLGALAALAQGGFVGPDDSVGGAGDEGSVWLSHPGGERAGGLRVAVLQVAAGGRADLSDGVVGRPHGPGSDARAGHRHTGSAPLDGSRNVRRLRDGRVLSLDRHAATATFYGPPLTPDVLAHPNLGPIATTFNRWLGREGFHAGLRARGPHQGRPRPLTAGKSTLMAALAAHGIPVLSDDVLIADGEHVFAAPRCIDLREPGPGGRGGLVPARQGTRWRLRLPAVPDRVELAGWISLRWGPRLSMEPLVAADLMRRLAVGRAVPGMRSAPAAFLALATPPAWDLYRPQDFGQLDTTVARLLTTVGDLR